MKPLIILAALIATPALADCPTGADLATGIRVIDDAGANSVFRAVSPGVVQQDGAYDDGYAFRTMLAHGTHILQLSDMENGAVLPDSVVNTAYPTAANTLPVPTPNSEWNVLTTIRGYGDIYAEQQTQDWGRTFTLTVGACSFDAIPGKIRYTSEGFRVDEGLYYLPELGIALLHSYDDAESEPETYEILSIQKAQ